MALEPMDWEWVGDLKHYRKVIEGKTCRITKLRGVETDFPWKVHIDGLGSVNIENQGFARSMNEAKRIAREAAEGRPRKGMDNPEFARARRRHQRRVHKPLW
jgi:hypothetical protein